MKERYLKLSYCIPLLYILISVLSTSCSSTKNVPAGDALYIGTKVKMKKGNSKASRAEIKILKGDLGKLVRPRPNSKILGIRLKLMFYNMGGFFKKKFGEPPVLLSQFDLEHNTKLLENYLENRGFFKAQIKGDTSVKRRRASSSFAVNEGPQYKINEISYRGDTTLLTQTAVFKTRKKTLLKAGDPFNLDVIKAERERIDARLKEHGYYFFSPNYLLVDADSSIGNNKVNLYMTVKPDIPLIARVPYTMRDIYIYSNYNLNTAAVDTNKANMVFYKNYFVVQQKKLYKPDMFEKIIIFKPGDRYSRKDHNLALHRLINLGVYKFVKNRFEVADSNKLDAYYYLTPLPVHNITAEISSSTKSDNMVGSLITFKWKDKNIGHRGEILTVHASVGTEVQYSGKNNGYNTFQWATGFDFGIPRFVTPFFKINTYGPYVPKTHISFEYSILDRQKLYTLNSFIGEAGYIWQPKTRKEHRLNPIAITYVQPINVAPKYTDSISKFPILKRAIEQQFIVGSNYNYTYDESTEKPKGSPGWFFNGNLDGAGNVIGLLSGANTKDGNTRQLFNTPFSQYFRAEGDVRRYLKVGIKSIWANRIDIGIGVPYGNSLQLPFVKQFFVGGNNSLRGFRSRSVGPGTYRPTSADSANYLPDEAGDIKLEMNTELRVKLSGFVETAFFIDAGNVWLFRDIPPSPALPYQPGGKFTGSFLRELAIDGGIGFRFDMQILLLRIDLAVPFRKPWLEDGHRLVLNQIDLKSNSWWKDNLVVNLAIGYPF
jgi:outer membrane protein insertion porin family